MDLNLGAVRSLDEGLEETLTVHRSQGHKQIPVLIRELESLVSSKSEVVKRRKAS